MRSAELEAIGRVGGTAISHPAATVRDVHAAVARRVFDTLGVVGAPVRLMHDGISTAAYAVTGAALRTPVGAAARAVAGRIPADARSVADSPLGSLALGALNGMWGDTVARELPALELPMSIRVDGQPTTKLAVFVHGLCETDDSWRGHHGRHLRQDLGYTPVYVRYNTGLRVPANGRRLAELLDDVVADWPVEVAEIALIGHSMGGLVARSACFHGEADGRSWTGPLRHVFCLGTPHLGAPLEHAAERAGRALSRLPETRPFATAIEVRSAGIKDLHFGNCADDCEDVPFLPTATYYFVGATLTREADSPLGRLVGDLLVQFPSASGDDPTRRIPFEVDNGRHLGGLNHFQLLHHPAVYEQIRGWLDRSSPSAPPATRP
jgi:pimeloyl-ACP methyl ester carboxylesterase